MLSRDRNDDAGDHGHRYWRMPVRLSEILEEPDPAVIEGEFRTFAEYLPTLCWLARGDGYIVWYNRRWHDYCGTTPDEMEGWGWQSVHDQAQLPSVLERWAHCISVGDPFEMVFPLLGADGVYRPFLTRVVPVRDGSGKVARWFGVNTEIGAQVQAEDALRQSEEKFEVLTDAMPQMVWSTLPDGYHDYYNAQWYAFTGMPVGSTDGEGWNEMFHPDDRERAWARWRDSLSTGEPYEVEYRLRHHSGQYRWTLGRALPVRDSEGRIQRWIGTCTDIDDAKRSAEQNELLTRELSHRIKNIFAVISGLVSLTGRRAADLKPVITELLGRIAALGRAHEFARPHSADSAADGSEGSLQRLIAQLLHPYENESGDRISISGDDVLVDDRGATPIALVIHELATNSAKYGALSAERGGVRVHIASKGEDLSISWVESGGPEVGSEPESTGFGTELAKLAVEQQLGGTIQRDWRSDGLRVEITLKKSRLHRGDD